MKKAVIFDLDGTLVNSLPDIAAAMNRTLEKFSLPVHEVELYKYMVGGGASNLASRAVGEKQEFHQQVLDIYRADYAKNCRIDSHIYDGVMDMLEALKKRGLALCVFSNKDQWDVQNVVDYYFPGFPFAHVRGKTADMPLKPNPAGALYIAEKLGVLPADCLYIGDTGTDMECGNAADMETVGVTWGFRKQEELEAAHARHIIHHPLELIALVDSEQK